MREDISMHALTTDWELLYAALAQINVKVCSEGVVQEIGIIDKITPFIVRIKTNSQNMYYFRAHHSFFVANFK
jgi:hypothetical protein